MIHGQRLVVVMPAFRAGRTLETCYRAIPHDVVDEVLLVDDASDDDTIAVGGDGRAGPVIYPRGRSSAASERSSAAVRCLSASSA